MAKIKKIVVDRNLCIGAASCVLTADTVFELDAENKAIIKLKGGVKSADPAEKTALEDEAVSDDTLLTAAQSCPTRAIFLYDEDGKQVYP
ncbi:ferredoxin [Candidatus Azambacteria bacterium]|nr:ferredoxin [Candidatus Azambacteria bacterium]